MNRGLAAVLLLWGAVGRAAPFVVEGEGHPTEAPAAAQLEAYRGAGSARVVRRYSQGAGWQYLLLVDGLDDAAALAKAEGGFPGTVARVIDVETGRPVARAAAPAPTAAGGPAPAEKKSRWSREPRPKKPPKDKGAADAREGANALLMRAVDAHGGPGAAARVRDARSLRFRYTRTILSGDRRMEAEHLWMRAGDDRRLDIKVEEGAGSSSTTVVRGAGEAWVSANGQVTVRPVDRSGEMVDRFGPEQILAFPLGLGADIETAGAWRGLHVSAGEGRGVVHLRPKDGSKGLTEVGLYEDTALVAYVVLVQAGGTVRIEFEDYKTFADGVVVPKRTRVIRDGALREELVVMDLDLDPSLPSTTFDRP